jgi:hypothetical protein
VVQGLLLHLAHNTYQYVISGRMKITQTQTLSLTPFPIMAPISKDILSGGKPPSNIAQLGMGWNIITGTIDLGLGIFDAIIMVREWIREYMKKKVVKVKAADALKRGKRQPTDLQPRSI